MRWTDLLGAASTGAALASMSWWFQWPTTSSVWLIPMTTLMSLVVNALCQAWSAWFR